MFISKFALNNNMTKKGMVYKVRGVKGGFQTGGYSLRDAKIVKKVLEKEHPKMEFKIVKQLWYKGLPKKRKK